MNKVLLEYVISTADNPAEGQEILIPVALKRNR